MKSKDQRRREAVARNSKFAGKYLAQADTLMLGGAQRAAFVAHKIGIPARTGKVTP